MRITFIHVFIRSSNIWLSYIVNRIEILLTESGFEGFRNVSNRNKMSTFFYVVNKKLICLNLESVSCSTFHWPIRRPMFGRTSFGVSFPSSPGLSSTSPAFRSSRFINTGLKDESPFAVYRTVELWKARFGALVLLNSQEMVFPELRFNWNGNYYYWNYYKNSNKIFEN